MARKYFSLSSSETIKYITDLWDMDGHIPAVHLSEWREVIPSPSRYASMLHDYPVPVGEQRKNVMFDFIPMRQLHMISQAVISTIEYYKPKFHLSLMPGHRLVESNGTTILVTAMDKEADNVIAIPYSWQENWKEVPRRMVKARKKLRADKWRDPRLATISSYMPPPQAVVSVVGHLGIQKAETNLAASGGACPLAICVSPIIDIKWDHRVYDASDASVFYSTFFPLLFLYRFMYVFGINTY